MREHCDDSKPSYVRCDTRNSPSKTKGYEQVLEKVARLWTNGFQTARSRLTERLVQFFGSGMPASLHSYSFLPCLLVVLVGGVGGGRQLLQPPHEDLLGALVVRKLPRCAPATIGAAVARQRATACVEVVRDEVHR